MRWLALLASFVAMSSDGRQWTVRAQLPGEEPTWRCKRLSPVFARQVTAYAYLDWIEGKAERFEYPPGEA